MAQIFVPDFGDVQVFPMQPKKDAHQALMRYFQETGVPTLMHADRDKEFSNAKGRRNVMKKHEDIKQSYIELGYLWQKAAKREIGAIKKSMLKAVLRNNAPRHLWDFAAEHVTRLRSYTPRDNYPMLQERPPREVIVQDTLDISELAHFYWYEPVCYLDSINRKGFPNSGEKLGQMLGIAHYLGQAM